MARKSTVDRLPGEVRELIGRLRDQGRTIDEIRGKLLELDLDVARSTLGRHIQHLDRWSERMRWSRQISESLMQRLGEDPDNRVARYNVEMLHTLIMELVSKAEDLDPKDVLFLTTGLEKLARAAKVDVDRVVKIKTALQAKVAEKLAQAEGEIDAGKADPAAVMRRIREEVYGIFQ